MDLPILLNPKDCTELVPTINSLIQEMENEGLNVGDISDSYHTFNNLYHHRAILFSVICNLNSRLAWKSKFHSDGSMFDGMFIVGIDTPKGTATYHYHIDPYWEMFNVAELPKAPEWDGHTEEDVLVRLQSLSLLIK